MWNILKSELRQWAGLQFMTLIAGLSLVVVAWTIERESGARPLDYGELRVIFVWLFFCASPVLIGWYWNLYKSHTSTFLLVDTLPYSRAQLNLFRLLSLFIQLFPVLIVWTAHYLMMNRLGRPFSPWLIVALVFYLLFWSAATLCHRIIWIMMWILIFLLALTNSMFKLDRLSFVPLEFSAPWTAVAFALLTLGASWWLIRKCPQGSRA